MNTAPYPTWWYFFSIVSLGGWSAFTIYYTMIKSNREKTPGPKPHELWNLLHIIPMGLLNLTVTKSLSVKDKGLLFFTALMVYRYWRTIVTIYFYFRYKIASDDSPQDPKYGPSDCTVIVATVGPAGNHVFMEMVEGILRNQPKRLIFSANNPGARKDIEKVVKSVIVTMQAGESCIKEQYGPVGTIFNGEITKIEYEHIEDSNKRKQNYHAIKMVETAITVMADDTAIWHPKFLKALLPAFKDDSVGLVGTRKQVRYERPSYNPKEMNCIKFCMDWYYAGLWNNNGALYLQRHNYEIQASNTADGALFAMSGRTLAALSVVLQDEKFEEAFENEHVHKWVFDLLTSLDEWHFPRANQVLTYCKKKGLSEKGIGPLLADDDNFITRWFINHGYSIKVQSSPEATITTVLGDVKNFKFLDQCARWSRTTFRQNPIALFSDRTIWWKWPIGVWTVYFPWLYNFAMIWDFSAVYAFRKSGLYLDSPNGNTRLLYLVSFIWLTKLVKTLPWFLEHRLDFLLYFFPIPAVPLFSYWHSVIKIHTALTCWNNEWSGRNVKKAQDAAGILAEIKKAKGVTAEDVADIKPTTGLKEE
ncbi:hypothetical protein G6011_06446 [Alternaria panax]|uniref:Glycosyltransferase family 2 protein n=1 Tax=Alternaria panax TaxID=48097 RepID=A0AAD4FGI4_9PLEO|nr:hypothetical protein G6011_06446 [Alternaria panax]